MVVAIVVAATTAAATAGSLPAASSISGSSNSILPMTLVWADDTELGSNTREFSGVAVNEDLQRLLVVSDDDRIFEYDLNSDGTVSAPPRRSISIAVGAADTEAIAWLGGRTYAVLSEDFGVAVVADLADSDTTISTQNAVTTRTTGFAEVDGRGIEGVAWDVSSPLEADGYPPLWAVLEAPPALYLFGDEGNELAAVELDVGITDVSDVWGAPDGTVFVLSDESRRVLHLRLDESNTSVTVLSDQTLADPPDGWNQPEGITLTRDLSRMWIVSEGPAPGFYSIGVYDR